MKQQYPTLESIIAEHETRLSDAIRTEVQPFIDDYRKLQGKVSLLEWTKDIYGKQVDEYFSKYLSADSWKTLFFMLLCLSIFVNIVLIAVLIGR
jgi:hypothetical protein